MELNASSTPQEITKFGKIAKVTKIKVRKILIFKIHLPLMLMYMMYIQVTLCLTKPQTDSFSLSLSTSYELFAHWGDIIKILKISEIYNFKFQTKPVS